MAAPTPVDTYSARGARHTFLFALALAVAGGALLYVTVPERLACARGQGEPRASCRVERVVAGRAVTFRELGPLQGSMVETLHPTNDSDEQEEEQEPMYRLVLHTDAGAVNTVQASWPGAIERVQAELQAFLADPREREFEAVLDGTPSVVPWALGLFGFGVALPPLWLLGWAFPALRPNAGGRARR